MKILQVSTYYLPNFGGIEQVVYDFSKILMKNGVETQVICFNTTSKTVIDEYECQKITRVGYKFKVASQAISLKYYFLLRKTIKDFNPDVIHIHFPNPLIAFYLSLIRVKCKITVHWHSDIIKQKKLKFLYKPIENKILKKAWKIIATSQIYADKSESLPKFKNKVKIIPNIVEDNFLSSLNQKECSDIGNLKIKYENKKIVFFMGVHRLYKGIIYLIEAAKYLPDDYVVVIAGSGPLTNELKNKVNEYKLSNIEFIGRVSEVDKKNYLYAAEVFAFPSITKNEAFGIALAEALYCGTPAVTFTIEGSGVNWVNQDKITGEEVPCMDSEQFALAIQSVTKDKYGQNAKKWAEENFTEKAIYNDVIKFFYN